MSFYRTPAENSQRLSSALLDLVFLLVVISPVGIVHRDVRAGLGECSSAFCYGMVGWIVALMVFAGFQVYGLMSRGQTWGMRIVKIRVVGRSGFRAGFYRAVFLRELVFWLLVLLPVAGQLFLLGHWISLFIPQRIPWRDWFSGTTVELAWD